MANFCQLTSGGIYDFDAAALVGPFDVDSDLARTLAGIPRFGAHTQRKWDVAIHSVAVGICMGSFLSDRDVEPADILDAVAAGLMHDAHEAVIGDITTPVAWAIGYERVKEVKEEAQLAIEKRLLISPKRTPAGWAKHVRDADAAALHVERKLFMAPCTRDWGLEEPGPEWMQLMYRTIVTLLDRGEHLDGGRKAFMQAYQNAVVR